MEGTEEMEGLTIGVSHESMTEGLTNLHNISSVSITNSTSVQKWPSSSLARPMEDITNTMGSRVVKFKSSRPRVSATQGPYTREDVSSKQGACDSGVWAGPSSHSTAADKGPAHTVQSGEPVIGRPPDPGIL